VNLKHGPSETFGALASFLYRRWAEPALAPMHRRISDEIPIDRGDLLDVGCGPGHLTRLVAERHPGLRIVGLDLSGEMIRQARRAGAPPNVEFREGSPSTARLSEEFDLAISVLSFHHWEEPVEELAAIHGALRPGGRLWIYEQDPDASKEEFYADRAPLWGWFRIPVFLQRRLSRGHGFSRRELDELVRPAVARTPFTRFEVSRTGSCFRLELGK